MGHTLTDLPGEDVGDSDCFFPPSEAVHKLSAMTWLGGRESRGQSNLRMPLDVERLGALSKREQNNDVILRCPSQSTKWGLPKLTVCPYKTDRIVLGLARNPAQPGNSHPNFAGEIRST